MNDEIEKQAPIVEKVYFQLTEALKGNKRSRYSRFALAALGSIPWVGGFLAASSALDAEKEQENINDLHRLWVEEHQSKVEELGKVLGEIRHLSFYPKSS